MKGKRRKFTGAFKAQVALEAIRERKTVSELAIEYDVHPNIITKWKKEFIERSSVVFETEPVKDDFESEREKLYAKIGQLEVERDWLKKISVKAGVLKK